MAKENILRSYKHEEENYVYNSQTSQSIYKISQEQYDIIKKLSIYNVDVAKCEELLDEIKIATEERQKLYNDLQNYENSYAITKYAKSFFFDKKGTEEKIASLEDKMMELSNELEKYGIEYTSLEESIDKVKNAKIQRKNNKNDLKSIIEENIEFLHIVQDSQRNITFECGYKEISINRDRFLKNLESDGVYSNKDLSFKTRESEISNIQNDLWSDLANQVNPEHKKVWTNNIRSSGNIKGGHYR